MAAAKKRCNASCSKYFRPGRACGKPPPQAPFRPLRFGCKVRNMNTAPEIVPMFATPLVLFDVPDAAALNADLRRVIEQREKTHPTTQHSNSGGYQSSWDMDKWGGAPAIKLLAIGRNVANRVTTDKEGNTGSGPHPGYFAVTWQANMWANINRAGHGNEYHCHRGAYWSGVYYVDDGGIDADPTLGGELEFMDPRGPIPTMLAPHL